MSIKRLKQLSKKNDKKNIVERIDAWLEEKYNAPLPYTPKPGHSPSSIGSKCLRKVYYRYWKIPKDFGFNAKSCRIFWTGDKYEEMVMDWFRGIGEHIPYRNKGNGEIPKDRRTGLPDPQFIIKSEKLRIRKGKIDNVAITRGQLWIYEIKSKKAEKWEKMVQPDPDHLEQGGLYLSEFNTMRAKGEYDHIPELKGHTHAVGVRYIYVNKDTSEIKMFELSIDEFQVVFKRLKAKIESVNAYADKKELPPKTPDYCYFCDYRLKCKENWNEVD